jgi:hypothetical protein
MKSVELSDLEEAVGYADDVVSDLDPPDTFTVVLDTDLVIVHVGRHYAFRPLMTLRGLLEDLLILADARMPSAHALERRYSANAIAVATAGPMLDRPGWALAVRGASDVFLTLTGDLAGLQLWEDSRGWGAYAELAVTRGTLSDIEAVTGPTSSMPRAPDDFHSGPKVVAYVQRGGGTVRVFVELRDKTTDVCRVMVHFQR